MVTILIAIVPAIVSMILAGRGMAAKRQLGNRGTELPKYYGVLGIITEFQVPIIFVVALVWFLAFNGTSYAGR